MNAYMRAVGTGALMGIMGIGLAGGNKAYACGGFFCQLVPIDQAGEQIIFRKDGNQVTAVVLILYVGEAEDFSWVVPVPGVPELSTGSDLVFSPLELATRPQFVLETKGEGCTRISFDQALPGSAPTAGEDADDGAVTIIEELSVGPFAVQIVSSDDPEALATWLVDNNYDLNDRGRDLIAPYVEEGMNFVALRLRQDQGVGDIQPLIMRYESEVPMIPIRLTAVAAQPDMGVIVWLLGESRAVPLNYLHVTPNYTRLNWYTGTFSAYISYQGLITAAMDEAGGQGFATDYAGRDLDVLSLLPSLEALTSELISLSTNEDDAAFVAGLMNGFVFPNDQTTEILRRVLPLPAGQDELVYQRPPLLGDIFTAEELNAARQEIIVQLNDSIIKPLEETLAVFEGNPYMTRLYTTLSPEEMTLDPTFSFNADLGDQPLERRATMDVRCSFDETRWTLTLGPGTDRDGELVIEGIGDPPGFFAPQPTITQDAVWRSETLTSSGVGEIVSQKSFPVARVSDGDSDGGRRLCGTGTGLCGSGTAAAMLITVLGLRLMRSRRRFRTGNAT